MSGPSQTTRLLSSTVGPPENRRGEQISWQRETYCLVAVLNSRSDEGGSVQTFPRSTRNPRVDKLTGHPSMMVGSFSESLCTVEAWVLKDMCTGSK